MNKTCNAWNFINTPSLWLTGSLAKLHAIEIITDIIANFNERSSNCRHIVLEEYERTTRIRLEIFQIPSREPHPLLGIVPSRMRVKSLAKGNRNGDTPSQDAR